MLIGRRVRDADGNVIGRVYDLITERDGMDLAVTGLSVGSTSWLSRFGWTRVEHGRIVPWSRIAELSPEITLRPEGEGDGAG